MHKVIVASNNPVKLRAVLAGFNKMFPGQEFDTQGVSVESGVSDQPMSDSEAYTGALNRTNNARTAMPDADFWVGIEGAVELKGKDMECFAWIVVMSDDYLGKARTVSFFLPPKVAKLVGEGKELGEADDIVFGKSNSKQVNGAVGLLTHDVIDRAGLYTETVVAALIPHKNKELYPKIKVA